MMTMDDENDAWISNFLTVCSDWMLGQWDRQGEGERAQVYETEESWNI